MKKLSIVLLTVLISSISSKGQTHQFATDMFKGTYETSNGRINGPYVSYYMNGQKRAEGKFENNYRIGKWTVYDATGRISMQRDYANPFEYTQTIFKETVATPKELTTAYKDNLKYNANAYIDYFELQEKIVVWTKRIWRYIAPTENKVLFENNRLYNLLFKDLLNGQITAYKDESFSKTDSVKLNPADYRVIAYRIKEDNIYDNVRALIETRIMGLCPVVINIQKQDTIDLCWFYLPELRKSLASEKVNQSNSTQIKTLDDLFFFRDFYGQIYKEDNVYDRPIASYMKSKEARDKEAERIEICIIETEHDSWLKLTKN